MCKIDVSIIIPVFNDSKTIGNLLKKLLKESLLSIEVIVINDGSTDNTHEIITSISDERIILIEHENKGVYACRNIGLQQHKGDWVIFLDADDKIEDNFIFERHKNATKYNVDVLISNAWHSNDGFKSSNPVHSKQAYDIIMNGQKWIEHCVKMREWPHYIWLQTISSNYIKKNGLTFHYGKSHKDILWTTELALHNGKFLLRDKKDYIYITNSHSITHRDDYYEIRAESYIEVISEIINLACNPAYKNLKNQLLRHALVETRHFKGLYSKKIKNTELIRENFLKNIPLTQLARGISSVSDFFFLLKFACKIRC